MRIRYSTRSRKTGWLLIQFHPLVVLRVNTAPCTKHYDKDIYDALEKRCPQLNRSTIPSISFCRNIPTTLPRPFSGFKNSACSMRSAIKIIHDISHEEIHTEGKLSTQMEDDPWDADWKILNRETEIGRGCGVISYKRNGIKKDHPQRWSPPYPPDFAMMGETSRRTLIPQKKSTERERQRSSI